MHCDTVGMYASRSMSSDAERKAYPGRSGAQSHPRVHRLCQKRLEYAVKRSKPIMKGGTRCRWH